MKSKTNWSLFLALNNFNEWKTADFIKLGYKKGSIYKYRKYLKDAKLDLDNRLKK